MAGNPAANSEPKIGFFSLFRQHWDNGSGRGDQRDVRYRSWTAKEFVDRMGRCGCQVSDDSVRLWYRGEVVPRATMKVGILRVFFPAATGQGDTAADADFRAMEEAWQQAQDRPPAESRREAAEPDTA
jgi:hypothetical protein